VLVSNLPTRIRISPQDIKEFFEAKASVKEKLKIEDVIFCYNVSNVV
jgi:hypothetical protein